MRVTAVFMFGSLFVGFYCAIVSNWRVALAMAFVYFANSELLRLQMQNQKNEGDNVQ